MQARRIARELALLSISQLSSNTEKLQTQQLQQLLLAAVRTLLTEIQDTLETASAELERGSDRLLSSETRAVDVRSARAMVKESIDLAQTAINRLGTAIELPELIQLANQQEVRDYALDLLTYMQNNRDEINRVLSENMVEWKLERLARIDQDILRIAVTEILYLGTPDKVAINEAVELAKRYSGEEGHRFINGVLRRVSDALKI
ncbi:transcription antitermination protein NusB [Oscillatoria sp. FACHB-1407]|uniref:transcription antitermination factor NusB n=1 Tax=Oscillatoria sp. FACHB-1407 TaxID=2692847 RepID=UPI001682A74B|nr:transcription antitermination factor NusB [Oscillatoria sp. FACHB-1407]MBD2461074.1 transcription antitermination protein NusB [Oscillatoria sp. FACHB-1407]